MSATESQPDFPEPIRRSFQPRPWAVLAILVAFGVLGWIILLPQFEWWRGWKRAEGDWNEHKAVLFWSGSFRHYRKEPYFFLYDYNPETGLRYESGRGTAGSAASLAFYDGYDARIKDLVKAQGVPSWGMKDHVVTEADLVSALKNGAFREIKDFPFNVAPTIVISYNNSNHLLRIEAGDLLIAGEQWEPVYVGRLEKYPGVCFIRKGSYWAAAFTEKGRFICWVSAR